MGNILTLDLGTNTGFSLITQDGDIISGVVDLKGNRFEGGGMRYLKFRTFISTSHLSEQIDAVYFEEVRRHIGVDAAHAYGGFLATLTSWCEQEGIPYQGIPVGTIKKHITGKGNASKQSVIDAVKDRGHMPTDDNEADAIAIAYYVKEALNGR